MVSKFENPVLSELLGRAILPAIVCCLLLCGCRSVPTNTAPRIEFSKIPRVDEGGTGKVADIEGRVIGARPGQQIVLFARSGAWYVQPFTDRPFTKIQPDSTWKNSTHLGTEYAALLVEPEYRPPAATEVLPNKSEGVIAVAVVSGEARVLVPAFWQARWFRVLGGLACLFALLAFHRLRLRQLTRQLNARFDERLEERTRIAQDLQDTLLQGVISASMHLYVVAEQLPEGLPAKSRLRQVQQLMGRVIEEGQNTVQCLRSITTDSLDLEQAFARIPRECASQHETGERVPFRVTVQGKIRPLHPLIRDEVYRIGREAVLNALRNPETRSVEVELRYSIRHLRIFVHEEGGGVEAGFEEPTELARLREQAGRIGARLKVRRSTASTEVELSVPSRVAFLNQFPSPLPKWFAAWSPRRLFARLLKTETRKE